MKEWIEFKISSNKKDIIFSFNSFKKSEAVDFEVNLEEKTFEILEKNI